MSYSLYELYKQAWIAKNPTATPKQYERAILEIAKKLKI
jgi:hypothetical protein